MNGRYREPDANLSVAGRRTAESDARGTVNARTKEAAELEERVTSEQGRRRVTSVDVARHLGVSQSTVSLALSESPRVSEATRRRVVDACVELGYRPMAAARNLRTGRSRTIGLFVPQLGYEVFDRVLQGVRSGLATDDDAGWRVLVASTDNDRNQQAALTEAVQAHDFEGLILAAVEEPAMEQLTQFSGRIVAIETAPPGVPVRSYDLTDGARAMLDLLARAGHRRIAHLSALAHKTSFATQRRALLDAIDRSCDTFEPLHAADADAVTLDAGVRALSPLMRLPPGERPTAVICDDSRLAAAAYVTAADVGLDVPRDLSVLTSHLDDVGRALRPNLVGLRRPAEAVGHAAATALLACMAGHTVDPEVLMTSTLVPGDSVAAVPTEQRRIQPPGSVRA